jgi:hypothetical protein
MINGIFTVITLIFLIFEAISRKKLSNNLEELIQRINK